MTHASSPNRKFGRVTRGLLLALSVSVASVSLPLPQAAAQPAVSPEAKERFKKALELYKNGNYDASLVEFERAYELSKNYKILFNVALVYRDLKDYINAVKTFERYFAEGGNDIDAKTKVEVQAEYDKIKRYVATVSISSNLDGAEIFIDDLPVGKTPLKAAVQVNAGRRKIVATRDGSPSVTQIINAPGGETSKVEIKLQEPKPVPTTTTAPPPPPPTATTSATAPPPPPPPPPPSKFTTLSWVGVVSAGAMGLAATGTGIAALSASKELKDTTYGTDSPSSDAKSQQSKTRTLALTTDILAGAAILTMGVTLYLTLSRDTKPDSPQVGLRVGPTGGAVVGSF